MFQVGYSHPVGFEAPAGVTLTVEGNNRVIVSGADKELVGETAARIRRMRPPEPYKGKGIKYAEETIRRKAGKAGAKGRSRSEPCSSDQTPTRACARSGTAAFGAPSAGPPRDRGWRCSAALEHIYCQIIDDTAGHDPGGRLRPRGERCASGEARHQERRARSESASCSPSAPRRRASRRSCSIAAASCTTGGSRPSPTAPARVAWSSSARGAGGRQSPKETTCLGSTPPA